jgi:hypothetical protein
MKLKPIPPEPYDGTPDSRVFHKFVIQAKKYMADGRVPPKKQVYRLSDFLKGKAYEFYLMDVAYCPHEWTLTEYLRALFDFCFPVDYRSQLRLKLKKCRQGPRRVREFVFELKELSGMIGGINKRYLVNRLWYGCDKNIRAQLYLKDLHPELSSCKVTRTQCRFPNPESYQGERQRRREEKFPAGEFRARSRAIDAQRAD